MAECARRARRRTSVGDQSSAPAREAADLSTQEEVGDGSTGGDGGTDDRAGVRIDGDRGVLRAPVPTAARSAGGVIGRCARCGCIGRVVRGWRLGSGEPGG